jgi:O-succinylbenzoic acid--CoA ligase
VPSLIALALPGGPAFVDALRAAWDAGDAVLPLDLRLPAPARAAVLEALKPSWLVDEDGRRPLAGGEPVDDGDALVVPTSGTTGHPKGAVLTHDAVRASALATSERLGVDPAHDTWLACLPMAHVGGLSVVARALVTGTPVVVHPGFDAAAVEAAGAAGATLVSLVATALRRIDPGRWRRIVLGGSTPPADLPPHVSTTYGMTETGSGVVYDGVPLDGVEVRTVDGEIHLRCPMLLRAYRLGPDPRDAHGWFATGDLGTWDGERLAVAGRAGDLIITGGEKVWPHEVEAVLVRHPGVAEVAVAGRPDEEWGQRVVAFVVPAAAGAPPGLEELRGLVKEELPAWAAPRQVVAVEALPRTALGKIRRTEL